MTEAFGCPGVTPTWSPGAKTGVGTSAGVASSVWFTLSQGIINEVYYPRVDTSNVRDAQFLVTADGFFSEESVDTTHELMRLDPSAPAFRITNTCRQNRYRIVKDIFTAPERNVLIQHVCFEPLQGKLEDYNVYALIAPHIGNLGFDNNAWVGDYNGVEALYASRGAVYMAVMCSSSFRARSVGYKGYSDGWQDLSRHFRMDWEFTSAMHGNVALTGQVSLPSDGSFTLVIGFGDTAEEASQQAYASLLKGYSSCLADYMRQWQERLAPLRDLSAYSGDDGQLFRSSLQVMMSHQDKRIHGSTVASLSVPWGEAQTAGDDTAGYRLVWPRDLVETAIARLAVDDHAGARQTLLYLASIQTANGGWHQNNKLDGKPFWDGIQLDETAFPIILAWHLHELEGLDEFDPWPMIRRAAIYLAQTGPVTPQERWEEDGGYSPSTLAASITALLCAADFAVRNMDKAAEAYFVYVADWWAGELDEWTYTKNSMLAKDFPAHYERLNPAIDDDTNPNDPDQGYIPIRNLQPTRQSTFPAKDVVDTGFLQLVFFGIRSPHDPHILNTIHVVDEVLKEEFQIGPSWHRYNHDGYGEQPNGDPFTGWGVGQAWPLLTGERAHYELAAGNREEAIRLARTMEGFACADKLLSEQVWSMDDIPEKGLYRGKPSGAARPLVWAHAEYITLLRSIADNRVFGCIPFVKERYTNGPPERKSVWRFNHKIKTGLTGKPIRIEVAAKAMLHWSLDNWESVHDDLLIESGVGSYFFDVPVPAAAVNCSLVFTLYWTDSQNWEGNDFLIELTEKDS